MWCSVRSESVNKKRFAMRKAIVIFAIMLVMLTSCGETSCTGLSLGKTEVVLTKSGQTFGLETIKSPSDASDKITFSSSNENVVKVSEQGLITAVGSGTATIVVSCGDIVKFCEVVCDFNRANNSVDSSDNVTTEGTDAPVEELICNECGGDGRCDQCDGTPVCPSCDGSPVSIMQNSENCNHCDDGVCPDCKGSKYNDMLCEQCDATGICYACDGDGKYGSKNNRKCVSCSGDGKCFLCEGAGIPSFTLEMSQKYPQAYEKNHGLCVGCNGSGFCAECSIITNCKNCGGTGYICDECNNGICISCGGSGKPKTNEAEKTDQNTENSNGNSNDVQDHSCTKCNGAGMCSVCYGSAMCSNFDCVSGKILCPSCDGGGDCASCGGLGKNFLTEKTCSTCGGNKDCRRCSGVGKLKCTVCNGSGECGYCDDGWCKSCGGSGKS